MAENTTKVEGTSESQHSNNAVLAVSLPPVEKEFEVLRITYSWDKYTRKLSNEPKWHHYKYYKTLNSALDAVRDFRNSWYDKAYYDYPALCGGIEQEQKYPHIKPTITIHRYKVARRDDLPCV